MTQLAEGHVGAHARVCAGLDDRVNRVIAEAILPLGVEVLVPCNTHHTIERSVREETVCNSRRRGSVAPESHSLAFWSSRFTETSKQCLPSGSDAGMSPFRCHTFAAPTARVRRMVEK